MDAIIVRCKNCKHAMKFSAEKAGKKAKCPKCETIVVVQADEAELQKKEQEPVTDIKAAPDSAAAASAAPIVKAADDDDDATGGYGVYLDPELEELRKKRQAEEEEAAKKKKQRQALPKVTRKKKAIPDAEAWKRVRLGLLCYFLGMLIWTCCHIAQGSYVLLGKVEFPEYANLVAANIEVRPGDDDLPPRGQGWDLDELTIYLGMISGRDFQGYAKTMLTLATVFYFIQALFWELGNVAALPVPRRFGMFQQVIVGHVLAVINFIIMFVFKLLPVLGAISYVMIPFITPEIVMTEYNMERTMPIHVMWSGAPFWENFVNLIFKFLFYLQPTFMCIFLWSIGTALREETITDAAKGMTQMSLGTFFMLFCFHMLAMTGASPVLVWLLRVFYGVWFFFLFLFMLQTMALILRCRGVLTEKIWPKNMLEE